MAFRMRFGLMMKAKGIESIMNVKIEFITNEFECLDFVGDNIDEYLRMSRWNNEYKNKFTKVRVKRG